MNPFVSSPFRLLPFLLISSSCQNTEYGKIVDISRRRLRGTRYSQKSPMPWSNLWYTSMESQTWTRYGPNQDSTTSKRTWNSWHSTYSKVKLFLSFLLDYLKYLDFFYTNINIFSRFILKSEISKFYLDKIYLYSLILKSFCHNIEKNFKIRIIYFLFILIQYSVSVTILSSIKITKHFNKTF